jgi:hypothetical protein
MVGIEGIGTTMTQVVSCVSKLWRRAEILIRPHAIAQDATYNLEVIEGKKEIFKLFISIDTNHPSQSIQDALKQNRV